MWSAHLAIAAAALIGLATPSAAAPLPPAVDLVAIISGGFADGALASMGFVGRVTQTGPGTFTLSIDKGVSMAMSVVEEAPCIFATTIGEPGKPSPVLHLDANKLTAIEVAPSGERDGVFRYDVLFKGGKGKTMITTPAGSFEPPDAPTQLVTSLTRAEIEAAIDSFREGYCPGTAAPKAK